MPYDRNLSKEDRLERAYGWPVKNDHPNARDIPLVFTLTEDQKKSFEDEQRRIDQLFELDF